MGLSEGSALIQHGKLLLVTPIVRVLLAVSSGFADFAQATLVADPPPPGYYDDAEGKSGGWLRQALHGIIRDHRPLPYSASSEPDTADALAGLDEDPADTERLICVYSGYSIAKTNLGNTSGTWNREHLWPQSYGTGSGPARTDLHHLRPEQANVNSSRGNNYFDESKADDPSLITFTNAAAGLVWSRTANTWEPPDSVKGDVARAMLYMIIRYTGDAANEPSLALTDDTTGIVSGAMSMGRYTTLLKWHFADPVSPAERTRNDGVFAYQTNRNPFVDRPEWVEAAFIPRLTITRAGSELWLIWTNDYAPTVVVEESRSLGTDWLSVGETAMVTSTNTSAILLSLEAGNRFYRLRLE